METSLGRFPQLVSVIKAKKQGASTILQAEYVPYQSSGGLGASVDLSQMSVKA